MISVVIPILNEEEILGQLHRRLTDASALWEDDYEIVLVDDGSTDSSPQIMRGFADADPHVRVVTLSRNFGHQAAISAGLRHSKGDAVVIMDGDLQDPPEELPRFLAQWRAGYHVVYAIRTKRKEGILKRAAYSLFYRMQRLISDIDIPLDSGDFCVMDRKVVDVLNREMPEQIRFVRGLRAFAGFRQTGVSYERADRAGGEVKYTFRKLLKLAMDGWFDFSSLPLRLPAYVGGLVVVLASLIGLALAARAVLSLSAGHGLGSSNVLGCGVAALAVLNGCTLMVLGLMGEYLSRIYLEVKRRPLYIVGDIYPEEPGD